MSNSSAILKKAGINKMSVQERHALEDERATIKDQLGRTEPTPGELARPDLLQQKAQLEARLRKIEDILTKDEDLVARNDDKDRLNNRRKEIELIIKKEMPSSRQQALKNTPEHSADFNRAVNQGVFHQKTYLPLILEWQDIMRRLEPEDPEADDTQRLLG